MKKPYAALLLLLSTQLDAQTQLPGFYTSDTVTIQCPQDTSVGILTYQGWEAYQTTDDTWNGPRDTSICIDLAQLAGNWVFPRIAIDQIDSTRPVFVRARFDDQNALALATNDQYAFGFQVYNSTGFATNGCPGGPCTGLLAAVRIPDAAGTGTALRWYNSAYDTSDPFNVYPLTLCVPTEKFAQNDLREFIVSLKAIDPQPGDFIEGFYSEVQDLDQSGSLVRLTGDELPFYQTGQFQYGFGPFTWQNFLVMHPDTTYPDQDHIGHLDFEAVPNVSTATPITVELGEYTGFNFQPWTQLRGGLVQGSDSVRHPLTVINNGADLCLGWQFVELVWPGGSEYVYQSGQVSFEGSNACFQFLPGSTLRVADGSSFHYGQNGRGLLLLIEGSQLRIGDNAELVIHGSLIIKEPPEVSEHRDMHLTLGPGALLRFAPGSRLLNEWSNGGAMRLVVTLDGGRIDITGLSAEDRAKVLVIELPAEPLTELLLAGNPVGEILQLSFASRSTGMIVLRIVDNLGRSVIYRNEPIAQGANTVDLSTVALRAGHYVLDARSGNERQVLRFLKQ